jgi:RNA polymerase primary sigma factor
MRTKRGGGLTHDDVLRLARDLRDADKSRLAKAEWALAAAPLVVAIARRYRRAGVDLADMIQDGNIGLLRAIDRFDPTLGYRFHTYAAWWIRQHIFRGLAESSRSIRVPLPMLEASHRVGRARRVFEAMQGGPPSDRELEAVTGLDARTIAVVDAIAGPPVSLSGTTDGHETELLDRIADQSLPAPDEHVAWLHFGERVRILFESLAPREREVLSLRFGLAGGREHTLAEAAARIGVSRERARRLEERALSRLRAGSARAGLRYVAA